ncbi:MAG: Zn-ribbon domain-containing OB-fold protein [Halobacteria archaeon]
MGLLDFLRPTNANAAFLRPYFDNLRAGKLTTTRCPKCGVSLWPPRPFCPGCLHDALEWVEVPPEGSLYTWSEFHDKRFSVIFKVPYVLGAVDLPNGLGRLITRVRAKPADLRVGMPLKLVVMKHKSDNKEWGVVEAEPK